MRAIIFVPNVVNVGFVVFVDKPVLLALGGLCC